MVVDVPDGRVESQDSVCVGSIPLATASTLDALNEVEASPSATADGVGIAGANPVGVGFSALDSPLAVGVSAFERRNQTRSERLRRSKAVDMRVFRLTAKAWLQTFPQKHHSHLLAINATIKSNGTGEIFAKG